MILPVVLSPRRLVGVHVVVVGHGRQKRMAVVDPGVESLLSG
jgi:hypothetical protein